MNVNISTIELEDIHPAQYNPRQIDELEFNRLKRSITEFGVVDPIILNLKNGNIIGGHQRFSALLDLGYDEPLQLIELGDIGWAFPSTELEVKDDLHEKSLNIALNKISGEFDTIKLEALLTELASEMDDLEITGFSLDDLDELSEQISSDIDNNLSDIDNKYDYDISDGEKDSLSRDFIVPPFSYLDSKSDTWKKRKDWWLRITGDLSETRDEEFGTFTDSPLLKQINGATSNFDPVLAEIICTWFSCPETIILDPFGGEQTKGVVAGQLGIPYHAVEFRQDQVDLNNEKTKEYEDVHYYCGDSNDIDEIVPKLDYRLCFTSPPYYDLEVYSKEDLSALGTYDEFMEQYKNIFTKCYNLLADNSFLVVKVGEIRNKKTGQYRCFVADNIKMFEDIGFKFYNDIVLLNAIGTAPIRARGYMKHRKVAKLHQNILVFYKGNLKEISKHYPNDFGESNEE